MIFRAPRSESGETLLEIILAVMILGLGFVAVLSASAAAVIGSRAHRSSAVAETYVRNYAEAVQAKALHPPVTTLAAAMTPSCAPTFCPSGTTFVITLPPGNGFPPGGSVAHTFRVVVEDDTFTVTNGWGTTTLKATSDDDVIRTHGAGATVTEYQPCPTTADLAPASFTPPSGFTTLPTLGVSYWVPQTTFQNGSFQTSGCVDQACQDGVTASCDSGLALLTIAVKSDDGKTTAKSQIYVRRGNL
jgi:type II secretory pathway pseudopilin PulG